MLRITCRENGSTVLLRLEGRLVGPWVEELRLKVLQLRPSETALEVDISDLSFADDAGEQTLLWLLRIGSKFRGSGVYGRYLCESLGIQLSSP